MRCGSSRIFVVAGEASGDALGAAMISSIRHRSEAAVLFNGVGGSAPTAVELQNELMQNELRCSSRMEAQGLQSLFPMEEISVMGLSEVLTSLPHIAVRARPRPRQRRRRLPSCAGSASAYRIRCAIWAAATRARHRCRRLRHTAACRCGY